MADEPNSNPAQGDAAKAGADNVSTKPAAAPGNSPAPTPVSENKMADEKPAPAPAPKPPVGVFIEEKAVLSAPPPTSHPLPAPAFVDAHVGKGGRYVVDPKDGLRKPVYEKVTDAAGNVSFRKAL